MDTNGICVHFYYKIIQMEKNFDLWNAKKKEIDNSDFLA